MIDRNRSETIVDAPSALALDGRRVPFPAGETILEVAQRVGVEIRTLYHYNSATQTRRESGLDAKQSEAWVEIHPRDAKKRGIADRDMVEVRTRRGAILVRALYSRQVRPGSIWMPLHFAEARANVVTNDAGDPVTDTAEYKVCAAEVTRAEGQTERKDLYPGSFYGIDAPA